MTASHTGQADTGLAALEVQLDLEFWLTPDCLQLGVCLGCVPHYLVVFTSLIGWDGLPAGLRRAGPGSYCLPISTYST